MAREKRKRLLAAAKWPRIMAMEAREGSQRKRKRKKERRERKSKLSAHKKKQRKIIG